MNTLTADDLAGLVKSSPKFAAMVKEAANPVMFNEAVPATQGAMPQDGTGGTTYPPNSSPPGQQPPTSEPPPGEEGYAAVPEEQPVEEAGLETPEAVGARAAQAFLGPIMEAAMSGDPSAQDIVARSAGNVAGSVSEAYLRSMHGGAGMQAAGMPPEGAPPAIATPEEEIANQIVGDQQPPPQAPQQPGENGEEDEAEGNGENGGENGGKKPPKNDKDKKKPPFPPKK